LRLHAAVALLLAALMLLPLAPVGGGAEGFSVWEPLLVRELRGLGYGDGDLVAVRVVAYEWAGVPEGLERVYGKGGVALYVGAVSLSSLPGLLRSPGVLYVEPAPLAAELKAPAGGFVPTPLSSPALRVGVESSAAFTARAPYLDVVGARGAWALGYTGEGSVVGVVDSGVDFTSPGLGAEKIAYDPWGLPLNVSSLAVLAAPLTLTPLPGGGVSGFTVDRLYFYLPPYMYKASSPPVRIAYYAGGVSGVLGDVYTLQEPELPAEVVEAFQSGGAPPRYGLAAFTAHKVEIGGAEVILLYFPVPGLVADVEPRGAPDGVYDTVYLDFSTALAALAGLLARAGITVEGLPSQPDYSFADEKPVSLSDPLVGYDPDGDGEVELGFGSLAGYFSDAHGFVIPHVSGVLAEIALNMENLERILLPLNPGHPGFVWPGLDFWRGSYAAFLVDPDGHGTRAAFTAAGNPYLVSAPDGGSLLVSGVAPNALIAGSDDSAWPEAPILWSGFFQFRVDTGEPLWLPPWEGGSDPWASIDPENPPRVEWRRLRSPLVDAVTNSWGFTAAFLEGSLPGLDGHSLMMDALAADGGPLQFFATGNSGPGFHTASPPSTSPSVVAVGAVYEMSFKEYMASVRWWEPEGLTGGPPGQPAAFSSRGPALAGWPRPEVAAVGWMGPAVGRGLDTLVDGVVGGGVHEALSLFSGTSMATPQAAGVYLILAEAARELGLDPRSPEGRDLLRAVLAASTEWMGLPAEAVGSGVARADRAVELLAALASGAEGSVAVLSPSGSGRAAEVLGVELPPTPWVHAVVPAGGEASVPIVLLGNGVFRVEPARLSLEWRSAETFHVDLKNAGVYPMFVLPVGLPRELPEGDGVVEVRLVTPYWVYDAGARSGVSQGGYYTANATLVYAAPDGSLQALGETSVHGNVASFTLSLETVRQLHSQGGSLELWIGLKENTWPYYALTQLQAPFTVEVSIYLWRPSELLEPAGPVEVRGSAVVELRVRGSMEPGVHSGAILVYRGDGGLAAVAPYTVAVALTPGGVASLAPDDAGGEEYMEPLIFTGGFSRGDEGSPDWRVVPVMVEGPSLLVAEARWQAPPDQRVYASNFDGVIYAPAWAWASDEAGRPVMVAWLSAASYELTDWRNTSGFWDGAGRPGYMRLAAPAPAGSHLALLAYNVAQFSGFTPREPLYLTVALLPVKALPAPPGGGEVPAGITVAYRLQGLIQRVTLASAAAALTGEGPVWASQAGAEASLASTGYYGPGGMGFYFALTVNPGSLQEGDLLFVELALAAEQPVKTMGGLDVGATLESWSLRAQVIVEVGG